MRPGISDWVDHRMGHRGLVRAALDEPVRGGARWAYVFGSALVVLFGLQAFTGIALAAYYSPSTTDAWASVNYLQTHVMLGWLLRGLHHYGASAMVVVLGLHILQTLWFGAFKPPRELNWLAGILLLSVVLAFALTGYLLPWDQKGFWATQVATSIMGTLPVAGERVQTLVQGGAAYGNLTLTRFYALHILVLPAALVGLIGVHVYLFRRHGVTPPPAMDPAEADRRVEPFFPRQLFRDAVFALLVLGVMVGLAVRTHGAPLEAPADPSSQFLARPEWYFLPLFQLLKYFEGPYQVIGTVVLPGAAMTFLALLPFIHGLLARRIRRAHAILAGITTLGFASVGALGVRAVYEDRQSPAFTQMAADAEEEALTARRLAAQGVPVTGPLGLYRNDPVVWGSRVFKQSCQTCHHVCGSNPYKGDPCLEGYASREWIAKLVKNPQSPYFFGNTKIDEMDPYAGGDANLAALAEFLYAEGGGDGVNTVLAAQGAKAFDAEGCTSCHTLDGQGSGTAPDLKGYASPAWLTAFIREPDHSRFYGGNNRMKNFGPKDLSDEELAAVVAYLRSQAQKPVKFP